MRENPNRSLELSINLSRIRVASLEAFSRAESECHSFNFNTNYRIQPETDRVRSSNSLSLSLDPSKTKGKEEGSKRYKYRCVPRAKSANALHARIKVATLLLTPSLPSSPAVFFSSCSSLSHQLPGLTIKLAGARAELSRTPEKAEVIPQCLPESRTRGKGTGRG